MRASDRERQRFHRHLRFYWQIHRHRMPQEAATKIHSMRWDGRVLNHSGRIIEARIENDSRLGFASRCGADATTFASKWRESSIARGRLPTCAIGRIR
jgi:uncharacterized NAD(P)/FAD-binding protein YdhS